MVVRLAEAKRIAEGAVAKARDLGVEICVAVCNREGRLVALLQMDGTDPMAIREAIGKAVVSAGWGLPRAEAIGVSFNLSTAVAIAEGSPAIRIRGGLPIIRDGVIEGACGVSGTGNRDQDEDCARAGLAAL